MEKLEITGNRIRLRPIAAEDAQAVFAYRSDAETNKYQGWIPKSLEEVDVFIQKNPDTFNQPESWFQLVIMDTALHQIVGDIGVHFFGEEHLQVELGCTLHKDFQGKGYATEALRTLISYLFNELNKHRITTSIDPENHNSIQLVERIGFRKEAHFVKSLFLNGSWVDDIVYSLLQEEWKHE